jgi:hypothetical protein
LRLWKKKKHRKVGNLKKTSMNIIKITVRITNRLEEVRISSIDNKEEDVLH